jgi:hypothetical protein
MKKNIENVCKNYIETFHTFSFENTQRQFAKKSKCLQSHKRKTFADADSLTKPAG